MASIIKANELQDFGGNSIITSDGAGTITLSSGMNTAVAAGTNNTPAFFAYQSGAQNISNGTLTKISINTEVFDTNSNYDTSEYRFTPTVVGKYFVYASFRFDSGSDFDGLELQIKKNGSTKIIEVTDRNEYYTTITSQSVAEMNGSSDYLEMFGYQASGGTLATGPNYAAINFGAYKIIE